MAGEYYYYNNNNHYQNSNYRNDQPPPLPWHLCFFLSILFLFLGLSWYLSYESAVESLFDQIKVVLMLLPVVLLLALHCLSGSEWLSFVVPFHERDSAHRGDGGTSPWGVALVLVLLIFMVSYKSSFQERWFPLNSR